jgi:hypothetical protein
MNTYINSTDEVKGFFSYLINDRKVNLNPDNNFDSYIDKDTRLATFTDYEVRLFNKMMDDCFDWCEDNGEDIYELCYDILMDAIRVGSTTTRMATLKN